MKKTVVKIIRIILVIFLAVVLASAIYVSIKRAVDNDPLPTIFGYAEASVTSGSMENAVSVGDMVIIKSQSDYETGDIICYRDYSGITGSDPVCVTHRIVDITSEGYITKGDANTSADPYPVLKENIVGTVVKIIPGLGAVSTFLHSTSGIVIVCLIIFLIIVLPVLIRKKEEYDDGAAEDERRQRIRARHSKSANRLCTWIVIGFSALLLSGAGFTMAAYIETHSAADSASVSKFRMEMSDLSSSALTIDIGSTLLTDSADFMVTGTTDTACQQKITIVLSTALPSGVDMLLQKNNEIIMPDSNSDSTTYTYTIGETGADSIINDSYKLIFKGSYSLKCDASINVSITAEAIQID